MKKLVFGSLSYDTDEEIDSIKQEMTPASAVAILVAAAAFAQSRGIYTKIESDLIIASIHAVVSPDALEKTIEIKKDGDVNN